MAMQVEESSKTRLVAQEAVHNQRAAVDLQKAAADAAN
jgi:hypothetical protein